MAQSRRTRIAALRRHLPELNDTIARMHAEVERGGILAHVYETALSGLIADRDRMVRELEELTQAESGQPGL